MNKWLIINDWQIEGGRSYVKVKDKNGNNRKQGKKNKNFRFVMYIIFHYKMTET